MITNGINLHYKNIVTSIIYMLILFFLERFMNFSFMDSETIIREFYIWSSRIVFIFLLFLYIWSFDFKISIPVVLCGVLGGEFLFSTIINNGDIQTCMGMVYPIIGTICFIELVIKKYNKPMLLVHSLAIVMYIIVCINLADLVINSDASIYSLYAVNNTLIAGKNQVGVPLIIGLMFINCWSQNTTYRFIKLLELTYIIVLISTVILTMSGTSIISTFIVIGMLEMPIIKKF